MSDDRASQTPPRRAVFLDRDGTLIEEVGYLDRLDRIELYAWSIEAVRLLSRAGFAVVVVTNQSGVARGYVDEEFVVRANREVDRRLAEGQASINAWFYCPHHPEGTVTEYRKVCDCRKPSPGMLHRAARELSIDLPRSFVVGDRWLDVALAQAVGATGLLVRTGYGSAQEAEPMDGVDAAAVTSNLMEAVSWILRQPA